MIDLPDERLRKHNIWAKSLDAPVNLSDVTLARLGLSTYKELEDVDDLTPLAIEGTLLELLVHASRLVRTGRRVNNRRWLESARRIMHDRFAYRLTLVEIGRAVGMHPHHLAKAFRRQYGCPVGAYLRRLRVDQAMRELARVDRPIAEIAVSCGFCDQSHFTRTFKAVVGMTPAAYRSGLGH